MLVVPTAGVFATIRIVVHVVCTTVRCVVVSITILSVTWHFFFEYDKNLKFDICLIVESTRHFVWHDLEPKRQPSTFHIQSFLSKVKLSNVKRLIRINILKHKHINYRDNRLNRSQSKNVRPYRNL